MRGWFPSNRRDRRGKGGPPVDERYLSQNEQSRTSARPLPLEVIENIQEAIWSGISGSVKAVLHRLVDMALADEATDRVGAAWHERTAERRAHRNGTERLLAYRPGTSESEAEWALLLEDLKTRGLRTTELIVVDGAGGLEKALQARFPDVPVQRCIMHAARNVMAKVRSRNKAEVGVDLRTIWDSPDRAQAMRGFEAFTTKWIVSQERAVLDLLRLPRGRPVEDQDEQRGGAGVPIRAPASAPDGCVHQ